MCCRFVRKFSSRREEIWRRSFHCGHVEPHFDEEECLQRRTFTPVDLCYFARAGVTVVLWLPWMAGEQAGGILSEEEVRFRSKLSGSSVPYTAERRR